MFEVLFMFFIAGLVSWAAAIGLPIYLNKKKRKVFWLRYICALLFIAAMASIFLAVLSDSGLLIVFAVLLGPLAAITPLEFARASGMDITIWTTTILAFTFSYFAAKQSLIHRYMAIGAVGGALLLIVSIILQSVISARQIQSEFARMEGECLSSRMLISSIINFDNGGQSFHALMFKGEKIFAWSYGAQTFLSLPEDRPDFKNLAPDDSCRSTTDP